MAEVCNLEQKPSPEALFRSASLVLADNAESEYEFVSIFFGQHSSLDLSKSPMTHSLSRMGSISSFGGIQDHNAGGDGESVIGGGSEAGNSSFEGGLSREERKEKLRRAVIDTVWKSIMEPAQEYIRNFVGALLDPASSPSAVSLLAMIRLNEALLRSVTADEGDQLGGSSTCPPLESHLGAVRMELYAQQAKVMSAQIDSVRRINGSLPTGGVFSSGKTSGANVKDSVVQVIVLRYVQLFNAFVEMSDDDHAEEDNVFGGLVRLRNEIDKLLVYQAGKIADQDKQKAFLATHYEEILQALSVSRGAHLNVNREA